MDKIIRRLLVSTCSHFTRKPAFKRKCNTIMMVKFNVLLFVLVGIVKLNENK